MNHSRARFAALSVLVLGGVVGCYRHHGLAPAGDAGGVDAAVDAGPADAGAPSVDGALMCPVTRADFTCLESFVASPGRAFALPLAFDACACCARAECTVEVDDAAQTLRLTSTLCADPCDCSTCHTPVAECAVPPLAAGDWLVQVNGTDAYRLPVREDSGRTPAPPACVDYQEPNPCATGGGISTHVGGTVACAQQPPGADRYYINLREDCGNCSRESTCTVIVEPRLTSADPPGGDIHVTPLRFHAECDPVCPPTCIVNTRRCQVPPLVDGEYYRVFVDDTLRFGFTAGREPAVCEPMMGR